MERTTFLQHYDVNLGSDGTPTELGRDGTVVVYEAVDKRTGEQVALTLVPVENIDPAAREQFELQARAVQRLRHVNIAKVFDFGREGENYVYVSEQLAGETLAGWVAQHGPMPSDATLRMAEQVVSVLSSVSFHKLPYPLIEPSQIILVPGQTPEGGWPLVKLTNFGLTELKGHPEKSLPDTSSLAGGVDESGSKDTTSQQALSTESPATVEATKSEEKRGIVNLHSEVYSLGATMYFLLTGVALSGEKVQKPLRFSGFPKPLRSLLAQMLHPNPNRRPKDLVVLGEMIRSCLLKIERRLALADRYGIPFRTTPPRPTQPRSRRVLRTALACGALVVTAGIVAAVLFPESIGTILRKPRETKNIGVLVGVPESSPTPVPGESSSAPVAPATVLSQAANAALGSAGQPVTDSTPAPNSSPSEAQDLQQTEASNVQPQDAVAPNAFAAASPGNVPESSPESEPATASAEPSETPEAATAGSMRSQSKTKRTARTSSPRKGSVHVRMIGITSDGRLIYRLPSGRTRIVAPDQDDNQSVPRRHRRAIIPRDELFAPPPQFRPDYPPYD